MQASRSGLRPLLALALGACGQSATAPSAPAGPAGPAEMSFFVTSKGVDGSARLGGLSGADAHCQTLAAAAGAGRRTWRAYLSAGPAAGAPAVHARSRIGPGPWFNARGALIARDLDELHSDRHRIDRHTALDEHGRRSAGKPHDILTGSDASGQLAYDRGGPATCANWTSDGDGVARIGHDDRMDAGSFDNKRFRRWNGSWNSEHATAGCAANQLADTGGSGMFYCFAADPGAAAPAPARDPAVYTFRRGVNVNHWLGDNLAPSQHPDALYGATWFDDEDIAWIAGQGFDHLRIWVAGHNWIDGNGELDASKLAPFDAALRGARQHRLGVVLAMYGLPGYRTEVRGGAPPGDVGSPFTDPATRADAAYLWWLVARRYAEVGAQLRFELLAQPEADSADGLRAYHAEALEAIRRIDSDRLVYLSPRDASIEHVDDVVFSDPKTALSLGFTEPEIFTFQFGGPRQLKLGFPGKVPDLRGHADKLLDPAWQRYASTEWTPASIHTLIEQLVARATRTARRHEVYIARIGVMRGVDDGSARAYLRTVRDALDRHGLGWAVYDYHTGGAVRGGDGTAGPTRIVDGLGLGAAAALRGS